MAPADSLEVTNRSTSEVVEITTDGHSAGTLAAQDSIRVRFEHRRALLAQPPRATFYHRLRDKFGRLSY